MRSAARSRSQAPADINLLSAPLTSWTLAGGALYLPDEEAILLPDVGAKATSPWVRVDQPTTIAYGEEWWLPAAGGRYIETVYADAARAQLGSNGNVRRESPEVWSVETWTGTDTGVNRLPEATWTRWRCLVSSAYGVPGSKFRNPTLTITR